VHHGYGIPVLILMARLPGPIELIGLEENASIRLFGKIATAARRLKTIIKYDKLNIATLAARCRNLHRGAHPWC